MAIDPDATIRRSDRAVFRDLAEGEGAVVLHLDSAAYHGVNDIGALIWQLLEPAPTLTALVEAVRGRVDDAPPSLADDVTAFVEALAARDLVVVGT